MDRLRINFQEGDLPSLHPHDFVAHLRGISIGKCLFEGLTRINAEGKAELAGARSIEVSPDGLRYTIQLRENHWSDGVPVTAFHYESGWKEALSPISPCPRANLLYIIKHAEEAKKGLIPLDEVGVKSLNDKTLQVDLVYPCPNFRDLLAQSICYPLRTPEKKEVLAFNGPFLAAKWDRGEHLSLKPNPYFWNREAVSLQEIDISMMQDGNTIFSSYENGQLDWVGLPLTYLSVEQILHLKKQNALHCVPVDRVYWLFLNTKAPALQSSTIRKALSLAIDRNEIAQHILIGSRPLPKPLPQSLIPSGTQSVVEGDILLAQELFEKGLKEQGLSREEFPPIVISYAQQTNRKQLAELIAQTWNRVFGIKVELQFQEWNMLRASLDQGLFEVAGCFDAPYYKDPVEMMERFISLHQGNFSQWMHPLFSQKIALAKKEVNLKRRMKYLEEAEEILIEEMPFIPLCCDQLLFTHQPHLTGYAFDCLGAVDLSYAKWDKRGK